MSNVDMTTINKKVLELVKEKPVEESARIMCVSEDRVKAIIDGSPMTSLESGMMGLYIPY